MILLIFQSNVLPLVSWLKTMTSKQNDFLALKMEAGGPSKTSVNHQTTSHLKRLEVPFTIIAVKTSNSQCLTMPAKGSKLLMNCYYEGDSKF